MLKKICRGIFKCLLAMVLENENTIKFRIRAKCIITGDSIFPQCLCLTDLTINFSCNPMKIEYPVHSIFFSVLLEPYSITILRNLILLYLYMQIENKVRASNSRLYPSIRNFHGIVFISSK